MGKAAIMGFGTVGGGVREILRKQSIQQKTDLKIKYILDIRDFPDDPDQALFTKDFSDILKDPEVTVVAEAMGGLHPAYEFTKDLLLAGKNVVTSNKELVATYGTELLEIAERMNVSYLFEASVGGGIPIIRPMTTCLAANRLEWIAGILNGTTNYILTEMFQKGKSFASALSDAQAKGYAEKNPAADVEGHDACRKIAILSSLAWGKFVDYRDIPTEGITEITEEDVRCAEAMDSVIKLIGYASCAEDGTVSARVCPMLIPKTSPLSGVCDVFNAIMVHGDSLGDAMFYGRGAGMLPTASAVVADMLDCERHEGEKKHSVRWHVSEKPFVKKSLCVRYFVRTSASEEAVFAEFPQASVQDSLFAGETAFLTPLAEEEILAEKFERVGGVKKILRVLPEHA